MFVMLVTRSSMVDDDDDGFLPTHTLKEERVILLVLDSSKYLVCSINVPKVFFQLP